MEETTVNSEDEISLIDLFAVLIRYRKFIVIFTLAVMVCSGVYLARPLLKARAQPLKIESVQMKYTLRVENIEAAFVKQGSGFKDNASKTARNYFQNARLISRANKKFPSIEENTNLGESEYIALIESDIKAQKIYVPEAKPTDLPYEFDVILKVKKEKKEDAEKFFSALLEEVNEALFEVYRPQVDFVKNSTYAALDKILLSDSSIALSDSQKDTLKKLIEKEFHATLPVVQIADAVDVVDVVESVNKGAIIKKFIIVTFAAIFLSVFIAFALNAWANIKADEEAYGKLKAAWDAGK